MNLNAPKKTTLLVSIIAGVLGIVGNFITVPLVSGIAFWLLAGGFVLLVIANLFKGL